MTKAGGVIPNGILPGTRIASIAVGAKSSLVYIQDRKGNVLETIWWQGRIAGYSQLFTAKFFTPLAVISWNGGQDIRIYCLAEDNQLLEYCYSSTKAIQGWTPGNLHTHHKFYASPNSGLAAVCWGSINRKRLYYQDASDYAIHELVNNTWDVGHIFPKPLDGSSLAAVHWEHDVGNHLRVFYQDTDLALRAHCYENTVQWYKDQQRLDGPAPPYVYPPPQMGPITAVQWMHNDKPYIYVIWRDFHVFIRGWADEGGTKVSIGTGKGLDPYSPITQLSAVLWQPTKYVRLYYQNPDWDILEKNIGPYPDSMM